MKLAIQNKEELPDDFTMEIAECDLYMIGFSEMKSLELSWIETRRELNRRGYTVHEWEDNARMMRCARCFKLPSSPPTAAS